jgi:hypothetical protein
MEHLHLQIYSPPDFIATGDTSLFAEFDLNNDEEVSEEELRIGLQRLVKEPIPDGKLKQLMKEFDTSGDGALQLDEFKSIKIFKAKLADLVEAEEEAAIQEVYKARMQAKAAKAAETRAQAVANILNDRKPTFNDGLVSCLPYLFPLADSLRYGRFIFDSIPDSPISQSAFALSTIYSSVPFAGLIAFFALTSISRNLQLNRLVRFSVQQAIFLDIALIVPGFVGSIGGAFSFRPMTGPTVSTFKHSSLTLALSPSRFHAHIPSLPPTGGPVSRPGGRRQLSLLPCLLQHRTVCHDFLPLRQVPQFHPNHKCQGGGTSANRFAAGEILRRRRQHHTHRHRGYGLGYQKECQHGRRRRRQCRQEVSDVDVSGGAAHL